MHFGETRTAISFRSFLGRGWIGAGGPPRPGRARLWAALAVALLAGCAGDLAKRGSFSPPNQPVRVACVGDSITFGAGIDQREQNCYPAVLSRLLGPRFETRNFGVNGATLLKAGDKPYWSQPEFAALSAFQPRIIILKLGTNDSKPENWAHGSEFEGDLRSFVRHCRSFASHPQIWLCLPVPVYETRWGINDRVVKGEIIPVIQRVARAEHLPTVDLYSALSGRPEYFPDKVHPNGFGAAMIAQILCYELLH